MPFAVALLLAPAFPNVVKAPLCMVVTEAPAGRGYVRRVLVSLNQTANSLLGGEEDETLSSRWARARRRRTARKWGALPKAKAWTRFGEAMASGACWALDKLEPCHCVGAIERDEDGRALAHQLHGDAR